MLRAPFLETILAANLKSSKSGPGLVVVSSATQHAAGPIGSVVSWMHTIKQ